MAAVDRFTGDYYLKSINGNIYIDAASGSGTTVVNGNFLVIGSQTNIGSVDTLVADNIITLSANVTGTPVLDAGIEVRRGNQPTVAIRWTENIDRWQVTNDGSFYANLMIRVQDDVDPHLGGNLWTNTYQIRSDVNQPIRFNPGLGTHGLLIATTNNTLSAENGHVTLYAKNDGSGGSQIYVSNNQEVDAELITKHRAIVYSLVL